MEKPGWIRGSRIMQGNFRQLFSTHLTQFIFFFHSRSSPHQVEVPSAFQKAKPSAPMGSHNQRSRAHRRYPNLKPLKGNYAPGLTRSTKQKNKCCWFSKASWFFPLSPTMQCRGPGYGNYGSTQWSRDWGSENVDEFNPKISKNRGGCRKISWNGATRWTRFPALRRIVRADVTLRDITEPPLTMRSVQYLLMHYSICN
jgi:hypothetical protein